jgi:Effector Associated Constant Component 1
MAETYTIESADDSVPIDPTLLRELRDLLREDDDLDLGVTLKDRPPEPGEQGALPVALEIIAAAGPLSTAFASVLKHWIDQHHVSVKVHRKDGTSFEVSGVSPQKVAWLHAKLEHGGGADLDDCA